MNEALNEAVHERFRFIEGILYWLQFIRFFRGPFNVQMLHIPGMAHTYTLLYIQWYDSKHKILERKRKLKLPSCVVTLHTDIIITEDKVRLRKHDKNKSDITDIKGIKRLQYKVQVLDEIDMLNYCACEGSVQGNLSSRGHETDNNMTGGGGETRSTYTTDS
jgi:hypothetical protein